MKLFVNLFLALFLGLGAAVEEAEAKRLGGGRTLGAQRQATPQQQPATPPSKQAQGTQTPATPAAQAPRTGNRWLAPLAGLAAGLGLAYLFGDQMGSLLTALLIGLALFFVFRLALRGLRPAPQTRTQYAGAAAYDSAAAPAYPVSGSGSPVPTDFDTEGFVREAKRQFIALQAANDRGDLEAIREFVTPEMYVHLNEDIAARDSAQQTDVVMLDAALLEAVTEGDLHWASIRFSGTLREEADGMPARFEEIWHLSKPLSGEEGWRLAGIRYIA